MNKPFGTREEIVAWISILMLGISAVSAIAQAKQPEGGVKPPTAAISVAGPDWPCWRGPNADGVSKDTQWNPAALKGAKPAWTFNVGEGYSAVSVKGQRLFTMGNKENQDIVWCLDAKSGAEVWKRSYACQRGGSYQGPRATPTVDNGFVYTFSREGDILCLKETDGSIVWQKNAKSDFQAKNVTWGFSSSPCIAGDVLVLNAGPCGLALNKTTGEKIWSSGAGEGSYASAVFYTLGGKRSVVIFGQKAIYGADLKTGVQLWSYPWVTEYDVNAPDPIVVGDEMFCTSGYGRGSALLNIAGEKPAVVYENKVIKSHFSGVVLIQGDLYGVDGNAGGGQLVCMDFKTGAEKWRQNLGFGSLTAAGDKLIVLNEKGSLFVAEASPAGYKELASAQNVLGKTCWTSPVFCHGMIYCRNNIGNLVALDVSK